jgi:hypothetical protein
VALEATTSIQGCCFWIDIVNCDAVMVVRSVAQVNCIVSRLQMHDPDFVIIYIYSMIALTTSTIWTIWNVQFSYLCFVTFENHIPCVFVYWEHLIMCD